MVVRLLDNGLSHIFLTGFKLEHPGEELVALAAAADVGIDDVGKGSGLYCTNGKVIPITWEKDAKKKFAYKEEIFGQSATRSGACSDYGVTHFYTNDGQELKLNPGKTYITLFPDSANNDVAYE